VEDRITQVHPFLHIPHAVFAKMEKSLTLGVSTGNYTSVVTHET